MKQVKSQSFVLQNCFLRVPEVPARSVPKSSDKYTALEHKTDFFKGYSEAYVEKEYPITSESVTSFAAGVDYKRDISSAVGPSRPNLGDVRAAQEVSSKPDLARNSELMQQQLDELKKVVEDMKNKQGAPAPVNDNGGNK